MVEDSFDTKTLEMTYDAPKGADGMREALKRLCERAEEAVSGRYNIIILSDRMVGPDRIPIPALLATAAAHHHLIRKGLRKLCWSGFRDRRSAGSSAFCMLGWLWSRGD